MYYVFNAKHGFIGPSEKDGLFDSLIFVLDRKMDCFKDWQLARKERRDPEHLP